MKRHKMTKHQNKREFRDGQKVHVKNFIRPMRGGIRL